MLLDNIALIASAVSALTAVTTSLRALGKSRENARDALKTGCSAAPKSGKHGTLLYLSVTLIWLALSAIFAVPVFIERWPDAMDTRFFLWLLPFVLLGVVLWIIWWKVLHPSSSPRS